METDLNGLWEEVISDYENLRKHDEFVRRCYSQKSLSSASYRYGCLLSAIPNDEIALKMRSRIEELTEIASQSLQKREDFLAKVLGFVLRLPRRIAQRLS